MFDAWGLVWCYGTFPGDAPQQALFAQMTAVLEGLNTPLQQGGKLNKWFIDFAPPVYCRSFASVYVLAVWTSPDTDEFSLLKAVRVALPNIETLTVALPPPDGVDPSSGEQHGRP